MKKENIYVCGPTVYDFVHIGNMRTVMFFDIWNRVKKYFNYQINYLHNITDIDDKIINKAIQEQKDEKEISEFYTNEYLKLFSLFNIEKPTKLVKVTENLKDIENYIKLLVNSKNAYFVDGNVFFDVSKHKVYGSISNRKLENSIITETEYKKNNPHDFALWKKTYEGIQFDSFFGRGRPGWHTECSVFIYKHFKGKTIDIHGGGIDLIFPHHENENIQHYSLTNNFLTKQWVHTGFVNYEGKKMSKSLGNVVYAKDFVKQHDSNVFRYIILTTNITAPIDLTHELIKSSENKITNFKKKYYLYFLENKKQDVNFEKLEKILDLFLKLKFSIANFELNILLKENEIATFIKLLDILGFDFYKNLPTSEDKEKFANWQQLLKAKKYLEADKLRAELQKKKLV
ncbi:cysteine--tRNA ligase [Mesomycoplasma neurolyticum]|uniref:Cysteine--tRNA ligase n=1 Tax=Mesomycoplasma neurolyticum TaxID=2120 RepID=A0A449A6K7_9BACT|nr:cysteine--tRNA ligase [Mesomycoplasma neurolyticum]VEU59793.1 Cysteine--tRNA ligase [Mesomycoplasma neurolyticum]